jgi:hypothetical protein
MSDAAVLSRIEAWESSGLIDAPTAARLREAELARGGREAAAGAGPPQARGSIASAFGPSVTVAEMFGYLGAAFLLAAWHALVLTGSNGAADETARSVVDSLIPAIVFTLGGLLLAARDNDRLRRAAGVAFAAATVHVGMTAWFMVQAAAPGIGGEARLVIATAVGVAAAVAFRVVRPALLTQATLVGALIALASALLGWANLLFPVSGLQDAPGFQERDPAVAALRAVLTAVWWILWAVAIALLGRREAATARRAGATPAGHAAARRATLTRFVAGMVVVAGTASAVSQSNGYADDGVVRSVEPWPGDLAVVVVSLVLLWLALRNAAAYLVPAAIGVIYVLTDLNATYVAPESGVGTALLVEGLILLGVGLAADRLRRRLHPALSEASPEGPSSAAASGEAPPPVDGPPAPDV